MPIPEGFEDWVGRQRETEDVVTPRLVASYRAIFGDKLAPMAEDEAPLGLHWCLSPAIAPMDALGADGHPAKNRDLPPIPLPRRMWAGGGLEVLQPIRIGDIVTRRSTIANIEAKHGRSGELWFVTMNHDYATQGGTALRERHDIVFREAPTVGAERKPEPDAAPVESIAEAGAVTVETPPTLLFRYSAITFNGHRIHYDLPYATEVEGYDGLVVHGPIQATLMLNQVAAQLGRAPARFSYRGLSPAIAGRPIRVRITEEGGVRTESMTGQVHMEGSW